MDRSKLCFACGEEGHQTRECTKEPNCPICPKKGHKAGSGNCDEFKKSLLEAKKAYGTHGNGQRTLLWWKNSPKPLHCASSSSPTSTPRNCGCTGGMRRSPKREGSA
ncbi:hypothetical protein D910_03390 [Dendroctonus ponderosae]